MGLEQSLPASQQLGRNGDGDFVVVSNSLWGEFHFEPSESAIVSIGIDHQSSPSYEHKSLGPIAVKDAEQVLEAFVTVRAVERGNAHLFSSSENPESCSAEGMKKSFQAHAKGVGQNGLFIFHFSGHGIKVRNDMWGLVPMDYDCSTSTLITASVLSRWMNEIECKAKYILITLDCCYAGGIGKELTALTNVQRSENLFVLSACTANETSLALYSLGHSIFTYFLSELILKYSTEPQLLPIKKIFQECQICCRSLSSLLVSYKEGILKPKMMQPVMAVRNIVCDGDDFPDSAINRFEQVQMLYNRTRHIEPLNDKCMAYLESCTSPLAELQKRGLFHGRVIATAFCSIMYSIASFEFACDNTGKKLADLNLCITAFIQTASIIDMICPGLPSNAYTFYMSWSFYKEVINTHKVPVPEMNEFAAKVWQLYESERELPGGTGGPRIASDDGDEGCSGEDMTDSQEVQIPVSRILYQYPVRG